MTLYDMGRRITELVNRREQALSLLERAPNDIYVLGAISVLRDEPFGGEPGGPSRDDPKQRQRKDAPVAVNGPRARKPENAGRRVAKPGSIALTAREWQVAQLVATGMKNKEVAEAIHVTENTVKTHLRRVMQRCGVDNRTQLARFVAGQLEIANAVADRLAETERLTQAERALPTG